MQEPVHRQPSTTLSRLCAQPSSLSLLPMCPIRGSLVCSGGPAWGVLCLSASPYSWIFFSQEPECKRGYKAAVQPGVHIPEPTITLCISHALPSPPQACSHCTALIPHMAPKALGTDDCLTSCMKNQ